MRPSRRRRAAAVTLIITLAALAVAAALLGPTVLRESRARLAASTVPQRLAEVRPRAQDLWRARLGEGFDPRQVSRIVLVGLKAERRLHVFVESSSSGRSARLVHAASYPFTAASGGPGPKLREGDRQVPEGFYRVDSLNPNSRFHLSLRLDYPSDEDRRVADAEGRSNLGGDIMIHGGAASIGCIAIGDEAIEEVFWLVAAAGADKTEVWLAPSANPMQAPAEQPAWVRERYARLAERFAPLKWETQERPD